MVQKNLRFIHFSLIYPILQYLACHSSLAERAPRQAAGAYIGLTCALTFYLARTWGKALNIMLVWSVAFSHTKTLFKGISMISYWFFGYYHQLCALLKYPSHYTFRYAKSHKEVQKSTKERLNMPNSLPYRLFMYMINIRGRSGLWNKAIMRFDLNRLKWVITLVERFLFTHMNLPWALYTPTVGYV